MKRIAFFLSAGTFLFFFVLSRPMWAADDIGVRDDVQPIIKTTDIRELKLRQYLEKQNSPLAKYAQVFIQSAKKYNLPDWRLVPAISGTESTFGKEIPANSYNGYGWANGTFYFQSWENSIDVVSKTLKHEYIDRGLNTVEKIAHVYAPPSTTWANHVQFFMNQIDAYEPHGPETLAFTL